ncbi:hypothetical protein M1L60_00815 [Actinoplanes sp. TRM 88003]|uniref:Uncharacterized protein n=1 Tax=Paractinoplanes aksuensis TaxID=2939490 RepID=A0ABT1DGE7_9ACTN|nr:hypothetical protein [Actinoplanes aksuensis]MCO8269125.1 hypothetical protein [Actinoplanes aksuensis]
MIERLTERWQNEVTEQERAVAAGTLAPDEAYAARAWPPDFLAAVDTRLSTFERDVAALAPDVPDQAVWAAVERVVRALNDVQTQIDTLTREELCEYIDNVLTTAGIDVQQLTARRHLDPTELTDQWRDF